MRLSSFIAFGFAAIALLAGAQQASAKTSFGSYTCFSQKVPCTDDGSVSAREWAHEGNACLSHGFGYSTPSGFFDELAGLDGSKCLTAIPNLIPHTVGPQLNPVCCVVSMDDGSCAFHCDLIAQ